jgi:hypothetical protein
MMCARAQARTRATAIYQRLLVATWTERLRDLDDPEEDPLNHSAEEPQVNAGIGTLISGQSALERLRQEHPAYPMPPPGSVIVEWHRRPPGRAVERWAGKRLTARLDYMAPYWPDFLRYLACLLYKPGPAEHADIISFHELALDFEFYSGLRLAFPGRPATWASKAQLFRCLWSAARRYCPSWKGSLIPLKRVASFAAFGLPRVPGLHWRIRLLSGDAGVATIMASAAQLASAVPSNRTFRRGGVFEKPPHYIGASLARHRDARVATALALQTRRRLRGKQPAGHL